MKKIFLIFIFTTACAQTVGTSSNLNVSTDISQETKLVTFRPKRKTPFGTLQHLKYQHQYTQSVAPPFPNVPSERS